jgi:Uma2 family endonuclease
MSTVQVRRWARQSYDRMVTAGIFSPGDRAELIDGEILEMSLRKSGHSTAVRSIEEALRVAFGAGYEVRVQMLLALAPYSEPEPDVAFVRGSPRDYRNAHPTSAVPVAEVADTTLAYDRAQKGSLYARAGVPDYWIMNLTDRHLEVYRFHQPRHAMAGTIEACSPTRQRNMSRRSPYPRLTSSW